MTQQNTINNETNKNTRGGFFNTATDCVVNTVGFISAIKIPCIIASSAATIGFILMTSLSEITFFVAMGGLLWLLGVLAAIVSGPWKYVKTALKFTLGGWKIGWDICPFVPTCFATAFIGAFIGIMASMALIFIAPAVVGLYYYFKQ